MEENIQKIRNCIAWIQSSNQRIHDWNIFLQALNLNPRSLALDMPVRWNSTYIMLDQCLPYKNAITNYISAKKGLGHIDEYDWTVGTTLHRFLKRFHEVTLKLSCHYYPTSPLALGEILRICILFSEFKTDPILSILISSMEKKFKKYWQTLPILYGFGTIFYPRLKLEGLESGLENLGSFLNIDCANQYPAIKEKLFSVYTSYEFKFRNTVAHRREEIQELDENPHSFLNVFGLKKRKTQQAPPESSSAAAETIGGVNELLAYLSEPLSPYIGETFDLVEWWRARALTWPILTRLVMDVFSVPVSTVASEQAFSTTGRILEDRRNALQPDIVEALVSIKDWDRAAQRLQDTTPPPIQEWIDEFYRLTLYFEDE